LFVKKHNFNSKTSQSVLCSIHKLCTNTRQQPLQHTEALACKGFLTFGVSNDVQGLLQDVMQESDIDPFYLVFLFNRVVKCICHGDLSYELGRSKEGQTI
jgi:hypothetical protein